MSARFVVRTFAASVDLVAHPGRDTTAYAEGTKSSLPGRLHGVVSGDPADSRQEGDALVRNPLSTGRLIGR